MSVMTTASEGMAPLPPLRIAERIFVSFPNQDAIKRVRKRRFGRVLTHFRAGISGNARFRTSFPRK